MKILKDWTLSFKTEEGAITLSQEGNIFVISIPRNHNRILDGEVNYPINYIGEIRRELIDMGFPIGRYISQQSDMFRYEFLYGKICEVVDFEGVL